ncbi:Os05g0530300, partial [Oryza sativa Japonica Group]
LGYLFQSFMDVQFPNGQLTYVAGEGITASGFFPFFGGLLQAHGKCPGETRLSFSFKVSVCIISQL